MHYLAEFVLFFAKTATFVIAFIICLSTFLAMSMKRNAPKGRLTIKPLNKQLYRTIKQCQSTILQGAERRKQQKQLKQLQKQLQKKSHHRLFVLDFKGDVKASTVNNLREEITALLTIATPQDEILLRLESPGGLMHAYGLAASQLQRIRDKAIPFTVAVDKVAASGGYMMACVANRIIAAPFAIIGSIGVLAQIPNFHRLLKKMNIDFEQLSAGEYKRTLSLFGENTPKGREKMQETIEESHELFKQFITQQRPQIDIEAVATGEHWFALQAQEKNLVDECKTSDDYLLEASQTRSIYQVTYHGTKKLTEKMASQIHALLEYLSF